MIIDYLSFGELTLVLHAAILSGQSRWVLTIKQADFFLFLEIVQKAMVYHDEYIELHAPEKQDESSSVI